jgi:hypothetical protein
VAVSASHRRLRSLKQPRERPMLSRALALHRDDVDAEVGRRKRQKRHAAGGRRPPSKAAVIVLRQSAVPYAAFAVSPNSFTFSMTDLVAVSKSFTLSMAVLVAVSPKSLTCSLRASICDRTNSVCIGMS